MKISFSPVTYVENNGADSLISPVIDNIKADESFLKTLTESEFSNWIFYMLLQNATCVKHSGFHEEREWRITHFSEIYPTPLITKTTENIGGTPQFVCHLPLDESVDLESADLDFARLFDRLIIGPTQFPITMADAYISALLNAGVKDAPQRIVASNIPIRT